MNRDRALLLISVFILAGLAVYYLRSGWIPLRTKTAALRAVSQPPAKLPVPLQLNAPGLPDVNVKSEVVDENTPWGRNPFLTEEEARGKGSGIDGSTIKAIIVGRPQSVATINGKTVVVGDKVDEETVLEIHPDAVVFERDGHKRTLRVSEPSISIKVKEGKKRSP